MAVSWRQKVLAVAVTAGLTSLTIPAAHGAVAPGPQLMFFAGTPAKAVVSETAYTSGKVQLFAANVPANITRVDFLIGNTTRPISTTRTAKFAFTYNTGALANGAHKVRLVTYAGAVRSSVVERKLLVKNKTAALTVKLSVQEKQLIDLINKTRQSKGAQPLVPDATLMSSARNWSKKLAASGKLEHQKAKIPGFKSTGENVAYDSTVAGTHEGYLGSPGHYENIVDPEFDRVGVGFTTGSDGHLYNTEVFGKR